jgi:hypothetical protein
MPVRIIKIDDVNSGNPGPVQRDVIVKHDVEDLSMKGTLPHTLSNRPDPINDVRGVVLRVSLDVDVKIGVTDHVDENCVSRAGEEVEVLCKIARAGEVVVEPIFGTTVVFPVEENDIDTHLGRFLFENLGDFEEDGDTRCPVVRSEDRLGSILRVGIPIGPGTGIPVGAEKKTVTLLRGKRGDEVGHRDRFPPFWCILERLSKNVVCSLRKFLREPLKRLGMAGRAGIPGAESALTL